jgi:uncharacterized membrane protein YphA (DoxX/SURF4 family)
MHPLSLLPQLLTFQLIAPFLLRVAAAVVGLAVAGARYKKPYKWAAVFYAAVSVLLLIGLYTQVAALVGIVLVCFDWWADKKIAPLSAEQKTLRIIIIVILVSLLFTGPGFWAMDLPL